MREIKFRAWHKELKIMRSVCVFEMNDIEVSGRLEIVKVWDHPSESAAKIKCYIITWYKKHCILLQYTGLKDKNGVEIYEGDIVKAETLGARDNRAYIGEIIYTAHETRFSAKEPHWSSHIFYPNHTEVIGNIYENPDLLNPPSTKQS